MQLIIWCGHNDLISQVVFTVTSVNRLDRHVRGLLVHSEESKQEVHFLVGILFGVRNVNEPCGTKYTPLCQHWI